MAAANKVVQEQEYGSNILSFSSVLLCYRKAAISSSGALVIQIRSAGAIEEAFKNVRQVNILAIVLSNNNKHFTVLTRLVQTLGGTCGNATSEKFTGNTNTTDFVLKTVENVNFAVWIFQVHLTSKMDEKVFQSSQTIPFYFHRPCSRAISFSSALVGTALRRLGRTVYTCSKAPRCFLINPTFVCLCKDPKTHHPGWQAQLNHQVSRFKQQARREHGSMNIFDRLESPLPSKKRAKAIQCSMFIADINSDLV
mmetsp:Transcript_50498/g.51377  ORF Transcript_50498/g.51377 Transcript_50498/m.51377 type:complete len:253 (+) Transcript_50498:2301-3059(+)